MIGFSMNGTRQTMIAESNDLYRKLCALFEDHDISTDDARDVMHAFDNLSGSVAFLCCTFNNDPMYEGSYSDMSDQMDKIRQFELDV